MNNKLIKLKIDKKILSDIKKQAGAQFLETGPKDSTHADLFVTYCYTKAVLDNIEKSGIIIEYEDDFGVPPYS